jgi:Predicted ATPase
MKSKLIVISGCSGGGKSVLISELRSMGYSTVSEVGREIVKEHLETGGDCVPWQNPKAFCELLISRSISAYKQAKDLRAVQSQIIFFDRSFLEGISYYQSLNVEDARKYDHFIDKLRYDSPIFMAPPWKEIYCEDEERKHSFEEAVKEYERLLTFYPRCGYSIVELPKTRVNARIELLLSTLGLQ